MFDQLETARMRLIWMEVQHTRQHPCYINELQGNDHRCGQALFKFETFYIYNYQMPLVIIINLHQTNVKHFRIK